MTAPMPGRELQQGFEPAVFSIFRRIRGELMSERRFGSYLRYAIGEIVLIVIGILLALQINDWNADRLEQNEVRANARALVGDLEADTKMLVPVDAQIRVIMRQADELATYTRGKPLSALANADLFFYTYSTGYRPYAWNRTVLERLKSSGALRAMKNQELARRIAEYDALTHHLDQDYANDTAAITQARTTVNRVRNLNYPGLSDALAYFSRVPDDDTEAVFFRFRETDTFRRMQTDDLPLLTKDPVEVQAMVNEAIEIRDIIRPRVEVELPRLRRMAADIAKLIRSEYPVERGER